MTGVIVEAGNVALEGDPNYMRFGVYQGRRGWLEADHVLNTRKLEELRKLLRRHR